MNDLMTYSTTKVGELLDEPTFNSLARKFGDKVAAQGLKAGDFNSYKVPCKDGEYRRFIVVLGDESTTPQEVYVMTIDEALELPKTGAAIRKDYPHLVG